MSKKQLSELSDQELLKEAQKMKTASLINGVLVGFLIGIVLYSIMKNTIGFLTIIPLFLVYKLVNKSNFDKKEIENHLKERNLR